MPALESIFDHSNRGSIASCLALALGLSSVAARASEPQLGPVARYQIDSPVSSLSPAPNFRSVASPQRNTRVDHTANRPIPVRLVTTCDDHGPGSLRDEIAAATSGETIDLSQLACSRVTLETRLDILQNDLHLIGPGADQLAIDGDSTTRIIHFGAGVLGLDGLTVTNGYYITGSNAAGGCIMSLGTVALVDSVVSNCVLKGAKVEGGGIYAKGGLYMSSSAISGNLAYSMTETAMGGGVYSVGGLYAKYSTIDNNAALVPLPLPAGADARGGGIHAVGGDVTIKFTTISRNQSRNSAGIYIHGDPYNSASTITNSTISSNIASYSFAGIDTRSPLALIGSTVVGNTTHDARLGAGVRATNAPLTLNSSIVAGNGGPDGEGDVDVYSDIVTSASANNLVVSSTSALPADTIHICPHVEPLAMNGGTTFTHALKHDSAAIDHGSNTAGLTHDQRLAPRTTGIQTDVGAVEWQPGEVDNRIFLSNFDGLCDG